jgi:heptosyltransferase-1
MHILLIRLSALGDIVHALPAVTDLRRHLPEARIDMAVDERFVDIPQLHSAVDRVIPIALKRWKKKSHPGRNLARTSPDLRATPVATL